MAEPDEYFKSTTIKLFFKSATDCSVDEAGAERYKALKKVANTHGTWVKQVQQDLIKLGYLPAKAKNGQENDDGNYGPGAAAAVKKFQMHAARIYRLDAEKKPADAAKGEAFTGQPTGEVDPATAAEIHKWIEKKWVIPFGRFKARKLRDGLGGKLREDVADAWEKVVDAVEAKGGILMGPYGDTFRDLAAVNANSSAKSLHYFGRAVDLAQDFAEFNGMIFGHPTTPGAAALKYPEVDKVNEARFTKTAKIKGVETKVTGRRYMITRDTRKDAKGKDEPVFRLFCLCEKQDGTQGTEFKKGDRKTHDFSSGKEYDMPAGWYLDLTAEIEDNSEFRRIKAHDGWEKKVGASEWWHYAYMVDVQPTVLDEAELIGISRQQLENAGKKEDQIGGKPG